VTIVLHSGRKLSERELSVTFTDKDVKVGLTGIDVMNVHWRQIMTCCNIGLTIFLSNTQSDTPQNIYK